MAVMLPPGYRLRFIGCAVDRVFETLQLCGSDFVVAEEGEEEALAGVAEETPHHVADFGAAGFLLGDAGAVEEGSAFLAVADVALLLEDADGGEDGVVGQRCAFGHRGDEIADGGFSALPQELHEPELGFG